MKNEGEKRKSGDIEKVKDFLPKKRLEINLKILSENEREIFMEEF